MRHIPAKTAVRKGAVPFSAENQQPSIDDEGIPIVINCITVECLP